jgi:hypothetical protein
VSTACQCTDVTLHWQYSGGHQASAIIWMKNFIVIFMYDGTKAIVIDNSFNGRLAYTTGASLTIYSLSTGDAGNYSVTVTFDTSTNNLTDIVNLAVISLGEFYKRRYFQRKLMIDSLAINCQNV